MEKTFTIGGFSTDPTGQRKVRLANSMDRAKVLKRCGHTDVELIELPYPMTREQGEQYMTMGFVQPAPAAPAAADAHPAVPTLTFEEALAQVPARDERGHFIKREVREQRARELMGA